MIRRHAKYRHAKIGHEDDMVVVASMNARCARRGEPFLNNKSTSDIIKAQQEAPDHFEDRLPRKGIGRKGGV